MTDEEKEVNDHRKALLLSGNMSDFQLKNLKSWPLMLFNNLSVKIEYNFISDSNKEMFAGWVSYDFDFKEEPDLKPSEIKNRLSQLTVWTKFLFWKDTDVIFKQKGKKWEI